MAKILTLFDQNSPPFVFFRRNKYFETERRRETKRERKIEKKREKEERERAQDIMNFS